MRISGGSADVCSSDLRGRACRRSAREAGGMTAPDLRQPLGIWALPEIAITPDLIEALKAGAWVVFNLSGGTDSTAAMAAVNLYIDLIGQDRTIVVLGKTGYVRVGLGVSRTSLTKTKMENK